MSNVSILVITKNEEKDLPACLDSVSWSNDIVVYDSYSSDATCDIARLSGARVVFRHDQDRSFPYGGDEALHRNWGIHSVNFKNSWLFVIDADERLTHEASQELILIAANPYLTNVAYRIRRRDFYQERHLRYVQVTPLYVRFFLPKFVHYERLVNPITIVNGQVGDLVHPLDHFPFSKGLHHWLARHNTYSTLEAQQLMNNRRNIPPFSLRKAVTEKDFTIRRFHQKELFNRLPARPLLKFIILFFFKKGFLDGLPGFHYVILQCFYEYMIVLKFQELMLPRL
jgi:glycosyltransferase involved in cell wall biosynthesis